jgi:hypothetical protein
MSDGGKGSAPRPKSVDADTFSSNWDAIFGKKSVPMPGTIGGAKLIFKDEDERSELSNSNSKLD